MKIRTRILIVVCLLFVASIAAQETVLPSFSLITSAEAAGSIKLNKKKATIYTGDTLQLKLNGTKKTVKWSTSDKKVATVSKTGLVTAKKAGKAKITAKLGSKKYTCTLTVKPLIEVNKKKISLNVGETVKVKVSYHGDGYVTFRAASPNIISGEWTGTSVFDYPKDLLITGEEPGTTTVTISDAYRSNASVSIKVEVTAIPLTADVDTVTMAVGETATIRATGSGTCLDDFEYRIMNSDVAEVSEWFFNTYNNELVIKMIGKKQGTATLTIIDEVVRQEKDVTCIVVESSQLSTDTDHLVLKVGEAGVIEGSGKGISYLDYEIKIQDEDIVDCWGAGFGSGTFSIDLCGMTEGETTVTITDRTTGESIDVKVTVVP